MTMPVPQFQLHFLIHSGHLLEDLIRKELEHLGLGPRKARIISFLGLMPGITQARIAKEFNLSAAAVSTMTIRLIKAGLITRETDPNDPRSNVLALTEAGVAALESVHAAWSKVDAQMIEILGIEDADTLADLCHRLRDGLGGSGPPWETKTIAPGPK